MTGPGDKGQAMAGQAMAGDGGGERAGNRPGKRGAAGGLWSSLSVRQAVRGLSVAVMVGLGLTALEMGWSVLRERDKVERLGGEILDLLDGAATVAVWTFDPDLGRRVANDALTLEAVHGLDLMYRNREVLATARRTEKRESWLGSLVFGDLRVMERPLYRPQAVGGAEVAAGEATGSVRLHLDLQVISADLWAFLANALVGGLLRNLVLGIALTLVFNRSLTRPLMDLGRDIEQIDPTMPEESSVPVPKGHERDELGAIAVRVNQVLVRLAAVQADLRRYSTRDPLTKLPNRALFEETLGAALARAQREGKPLAVMAVTMLPGALRKGGDRAVLDIATRLTDCTRSADLVARLAADEFVVVLSDSDAVGAMRVADRFMAGLGHGLALPEGRIDNSPALGIALYPLDGGTAEALTTKARAAAQATSPGSIGYAAPGMGEQSRAMLARADGLIAALEQGGIKLMFQAQVEAGSRQPQALVAIPRCDLPRESLEGRDLVTAAREVGLEVALQDHVLREALRAAAQGPDLPIVVRCVERQLADPDFPTLVERLLRHGAGEGPGVPLVLLAPQGVAESAACLDGLARLRALGLEVWLDVTQPEAVTIGLLSEGRCSGLEFLAPSTGLEMPPALSALLSLAQSRGLMVAARGVEGAGQWAAILRSGTKRFRGTLVAPPVAMADMAAQIATLPERADRGRQSGPDGGGTA